MIAHTHLHVSDYAKSKAFYIKVLATLGYVNNMEVVEAAGFFEGKNTDLWGVREAVVPTHLAFEAKTKEEVQAFHKAALDSGATDNGGPGYRENYWAGYYAAFVLDPDRAVVPAAAVIANVAVAEHAGDPPRVADDVVSADPRAGVLEPGDRAGLAPLDRVDHDPIDRPAAASAVVARVRGDEAHGRCRLRCCNLEPAEKDQGRGPSAQLRLHGFLSSPSERL